MSEHIGWRCKCAGFDQYGRPARVFGIRVSTPENPYWGCGETLCKAEPDTWPDDSDGYPAAAESEVLD